MRRDRMWRHGLLLVLLCWGHGHCRGRHGGVCSGLGAGGGTVFAQGSDGPGLLCARACRLGRHGQAVAADAECATPPAVTPPQAVLEQAGPTNAARWRDHGVHTSAFRDLELCAVNALREAASGEGGPAEPPAGSRRSAGPTACAASRGTSSANGVGSG